MMLAGCAAQSPPPVAVAPAPGTTHLIHSLSSLSAAPINPLGPQTVPGRGDALINPPGAAQAAVRTFQQTPGLVRSVGTGEQPGKERLLNAKAAKFGDFSETLLNRVFAQLGLLERTDIFSRIRVPTGIRPVVITAIMDPRGKLRELIIERHSGKAIIDKLFIEAIKRGLWYRNPPVEARYDKNGYRFTVEGKIEDFATEDQIHWRFKTSIGLGIE
ncbi:MAG: hypothetical protein ACREQI_15765 [Candidatus Binataceae bacterium]